MCIQLQNSPILQFCSLSPLIIFSPLIDLRGTIQSFVYASILFAGIRTGTRLFTLFIKILYLLTIYWIHIFYLPPLPPKCNDQSFLLLLKPVYYVLSPMSKRQLYSCIDSEVLFHILFNRLTNRQCPEFDRVLCLDQL